MHYHYALYQKLPRLLNIIETFYEIPIYTLSLLLPASPLISNDTNRTTQNYSDLTYVSNSIITECKTNSISNQTICASSCACIFLAYMYEASTQTKARLQAQDNGKFAFVFLCLWMRVAPVYT